MKQNKNIALSLLLRYAHHAVGNTNCPCRIYFMFVIFHTFVYLFFMLIFTLQQLLVMFYVVHFAPPGTALVSGLCLVSGMIGLIVINMICYFCILAQISDLFVRGLFCNKNNQELCNTVCCTRTFYTIVPLFLSFNKDYKQRKNIRVKTDD